MLSKIFLLGIFSINSLCLSAQDIKKDNEPLRTKMDAFISSTGRITKFVDTKLPVLKTAYDRVETRIRKIGSGTTPSYFYQIIKKGQYSTTTASIEYFDLLEVLKALKVLKQEVDKDIADNPDYLENKFITVDGFQVGYYVTNKKATWYIELERYGSNNSLFFDDGNTIEIVFTEAKNKIDELKK